MSNLIDEPNNPSGCPKCGNGSVSPVTYTWWGGLIGPKMLHHTKCNSCDYRFNSKTRKSNTPGIIIYSAVIFVIAAVAIYFMRTM